MHPIERLRYVARASGVPQSALVQETAAALSSFAGDPHGLITACQRVVARQPRSGPLVWFAARVLTGPDPFAEVWAAAGELQADPTAAQLARALPDDATVCVVGWPAEIAEALPRRGDVEVLVVEGGGGSGFVDRMWRADVDAVDVPAAGLGAAAASADLVLLEALAIGPDTFMAATGSRAAAAVAHHAGVPVWLVGGVGRVLPGRMFDGLRSRVENVEEPWEADEEFVPLDLVDRIVGVDGPEPVADGLRRCDCPVAPELFKGIVL